jgi:hypothetical protein
MHTATRGPETTNETLRPSWRWRTGWTWGPDEGSESSRRLGRVLVAVVTLVAFVYCARTGWSVLQALRQVRLADLRLAAELLSVGDVLLCLIGYGLGKEILEAAIRRR